MKHELFFFNNQFRQSMFVKWFQLSDLIQFSQCLHIIPASSSHFVTDRVKPEKFDTFPELRSITFCAHPLAERPFKFLKLHTTRCCCIRTYEEEDAPLPWLLVQLKRTCSLAWRIHVPWMLTLGAIDAFLTSATNSSVIVYFTRGSSSKHEQRRKFGLFAAWEKWQKRLNCRCLQCGQVSSKLQVGMRDYPRDTEEILKADRINDLSFVKQILSCFAVENDEFCTFICMQIA